MSSSKSGSVTEEIFTSTPRVTVKFNLGQDKTLTLPFEMETSARQLRKELSHILKVPLQDLNISHNSMFINDSQTLADFAVTNCGSIVMNLNTNHHIDVSLLFTQIYGDLPIKDVISVTVAMGKGKDPKHLSVEIIDEKIRKIFIGGYRHRLSGKEYHNAYSQTLFISKRAGENKKRYERDSQTSPRKVSKLEETPQLVATQTPVRGLYIIEPLNKQVIPRSYTSTSDFEEKVLHFQNELRNWLCRARTNLYKRKIQEDAFADEEIDIKVIPTATIEKICEDDENMKQLGEKSYTGKIKSYSNKYLLMKEIKHLMMIEKERREAREKFEKIRNLNTVKKFSQPFKWMGKDGHKLSMETEHHREFCKWQEIYGRLINRDIPISERKQLIIMIKEMLEEMGDEDSLRIQDLLVREIDLLEAGMKGKHLTTLQAITEKYFLVFLEDYAQKCFTKVDQLTQIKEQIFLCKNCKKVKPESSFHINTRVRRANKCKSCFWVENMHRQYVDYSLYGQMLRSLQREEEKYNCLYSAAFMLQAEDIYYIVNTIWHGQSILSENKDLANLRLCRFDNAIQWSPWNCFLITHKEMLSHNLVDDPLEIYGAWLIEQVRTKHLMAQLHFKDLYKKSLRPIQNKTWLNSKIISDDKTWSWTSIKLPSNKDNKENAL